MIKNFKSLDDEIATLSKDKSQKDKVKTLSKDLDAKGKKIEAELSKILDITRKEFGKHGANIDRLLAETKKMFKELQSGVKAMQKDFDHDQFLELRQLARKIEANGDTAGQDNKDFGGSWAELRGTNFTKQGLAEKYNGKFYKERFELMGDAKSVVNKIEEIRQIGRQGAVLSNELVAALTGDQQDKKQYEEDTAEMAKKVAKLHQDYEDKTRDSGALRRTREAMKVDPKAAGSLVGKIRSFFQDMAALNKEIKNEQKTLDQELKQMIKFGKDPTPKAKQSLTEATKQLKDFPGFAQAAAERAKEWAELYKEGAAIAKKAGAK
jgi:hypothetical protein